MRGVMKLFQVLKRYVEERQHSIEVVSYGLRFRENTSS